jgi:ferric-dicitrate binding protein FerR (iron transport regulator)
MATAIIAILAIGFAWMRWSQPVSHITAFGETLTISLPDASSVSLNAGTTLTYARDFNRAHREVMLDGEAYFEVEQGEHPFLVKTGFAEIRVLGTRFNVRAREGIVEVGVNEGLVAVNVDTGGESRSVELEAGDWIACNRHGFISNEAKSLPEEVSFPVWRQGGFYFSEHPLSHAILEIELFHDVEIVLAIDVPDIRVTGLMQGTLEEIVRALCVSIDKEYRRDENGVFYIEE